MTMDLKTSNQRGISLIPALLVLTTLFVLAAVYFGMVLPDQTRRIAGLLKGTASSNLAETGLNRAMGLLARNPDLDRIVTGPYGYARRDAHTIYTSQIVNDANGVRAGQVELALDAGDPATNGRDRYGNAIWFSPAKQNFDPAQGLYRFGITAYGTPFKNGASVSTPGLRGVYAVVTVSGAPAGGGVSPSLFFLHTTSDLSIAGGSIWYGPIDTDGTIHFWWDSTHPGSNLNKAIQIYSSVTYAGSPPDYKQYSQVNPGGQLLPEATTVNNPAYFQWGPNASAPDSTLQPRQVAAKGPLLIDFAAVKALTNPNCGIVSDPANGCYVGDQDFQTTYFGPAGLQVNSTAVNPGDIVYIGPDMDIRLTPDATHLAYFYRSIPPNGTILVVDGTVRLGSAPSGPTPGAGTATIIGGRLSIVSYTTQAQNNAALGSPGNIVVYGNVVYRNPVDIADPKAGRQVDPATGQFVSNPDGSPTGNGAVNALGLFAAHYVWVYVPNLYQPLLGQQDAPDSIQIFGQVVAGASPGSTAAFKQYYAPATNPKYKSAVDTLILYGAISSAGPPETDYFSTRTYFFDRSLGHPGNPRLPGLPLFGPAANPSPSPSATAGVPRVVSGTWREITK